MTHFDSAPDPAPAADAVSGGARLGTRLLLAFAVIAALCSALLLSEASAQPASAAKAPQTSTTLDLANAAAVAATSGVTIEIKNYAFAPATATVAVGTKVTWVNEDTVPHTVTTTSGPASFDSGQVAPGASFSAIFETAGTYSYYCADHPNMKATITVTGGSTPSGSPTATPTSASPTPSASTTSSSPTATAGTPTSTGGMSMSPTATSTGGSGGVLGSVGSSSGCASLSSVLLPLLQHIDAAHLGESPGQQAQDLLNLNQYVLTHTTLVENMLVPLWNSTNTILTGLLVPLLQHVDAAHLSESPGQQVSDLLNLDQWILNHTTLVENMIAPTEGVLTGSC
ncbi:MAG TPA: cupredoxin family copper-binding protein [Actinospica sp.]|jgi:plastocyanin|nr:cupredoxin family copper-binding protein [Actinospica sp.]